MERGERGKRDGEGRGMERGDRHQSTYKITALHRERDRMANGFHGS